MAWFTAASSGATCVAAYDAIGASSLADSYVNEANPGTNDAAPGTAPTWANGTGWTFNGTTQYLDSLDVGIDGTWSMLIRYSGYIADGAYQGLAGDVVGLDFFQVNLGTTGDVGVYYGNGGFARKAGAPPASGVIGFAGASAYLDGVDQSVTIPSSSGTLTNFKIGTRGATGNFFSGDIQAVAVYSGTIDATDVTTITAAMNALPTSGASPVPIIMQAHHAQGWL